MLKPLPAILIILVCLLIGAGLTMGIAWVASNPYRVPNSHLTVEAVKLATPDHAYWTVYHQDRFACDVINSDGRIMSSGTPMTTDADPDDLLPRWANSIEPALDPRRNPDLFDQQMTITTASGWPMLAMYWQQRPDYDPKQRAWIMQVDHGLLRRDTSSIQVRTVPGVATSVWMPVRAYPLGILWMGFIINTLLFGGILTTILLLPRYLRDRHRRNTGACRHCGYAATPDTPLNTCPECGNPRAVGQRAAAAGGRTATVRGRLMAVRPRTIAVR